MQNIESSIEVEDDVVCDAQAGSQPSPAGQSDTINLDTELAEISLADCVHRVFNLESSSLSDVDKFKRRLIRSIARSMYVDKVPEAEMWERLRKDTDCDCFVLMKRMRALTLKKLKRLLAAEDRWEDVTKVARLTITDWLLFDLIIVHENVDLIGKDSTLESTEEPKVLDELFELVTKYNIEPNKKLGKDHLIKAWLHLTIDYNSRGRQCSPMLLQRRWYQMQQVARLKFYQFWYSYRGYADRLQQIWDGRPTELQTRIAKRFPNLIIEPFPEWEDMITSGAVILREDFERLTMAEPVDNITENVADVQIIETPVETIQIDEDSDVDDVEKMPENSVNTQTTIDATKKLDSGKLGVHIVNIKTEPAEHITNDIAPTVEDGSVEQENETRVLLRTEILNNKVAPISNFSGSVCNNNDELLPKIMNVTGGVELIESDDEAEVLQQYDLSKASIQTETNSGTTGIITSEGRISNNSDNVSINCLMSDSKVANYAGDEQDFEVQMNDLIILDDGITLEDDGIEDDECEDMIQVKTESEQPKQNADKEDDNPKFDFKLLLTPVVYTKKLDDMDVFKFNDFKKVQDIQIIECSYNESKPVDVKQKPAKDTIIVKEESKVTQSANNFNLEKNVSLVLELGKNIEHSILISDHQKVKYSSWLLQKPKNRSYNPIQLCKNPDFNTRLKRLNAGFLISERNRLMLKECKRLTVDLHKAFENKLIDGTLYLKNSKFTHNYCNTYNQGMIKNTLVEPSTAETLGYSKEDSSNETLKTYENVRNITNTNPNFDTKLIEGMHVSDLENPYTIKSNNLTVEISPIEKDAKPPVKIVDKMEVKENNTSDLIEEPEIEACNTSFYIENERKSNKFNENNSYLNSEQEKLNKYACNVDSYVEKVDNDRIEPLELEPTNHRRAKKTLSRTQIQRSLNKLFQKAPINYRYPLPSRTPLRWGPNLKSPQNTNININNAYGDALLASSTLEKMIQVLSNQPIDNKIKKHKRRVILEDLKEKMKPGRKKNFYVTQTENIEVKLDDLKNSGETKQNKDSVSEANDKDVKIKTNINKRGRPKGKKVNKVELGLNRYCCWALEKLITNKQPKSPHHCPHPVCICCCRDRLLEKTLQDKRPKIVRKRKRTDSNSTGNEPPIKNPTKNDIINQETVNSIPIVLSDDEEYENAKDNDEANKDNSFKNITITPLFKLQEIEPVCQLTKESNNIIDDAEDKSNNEEVCQLTKESNNIIDDAEDKSNNEEANKDNPTKSTTFTPIQELEPQELQPVQELTEDINNQENLPQHNLASSTTSSRTRNSSNTCKTRVFAQNSPHFSKTVAPLHVPNVNVTPENIEIYKPTMASYTIQPDHVNFALSKVNSTDSSKPIFLGKNNILLYSSDKLESSTPELLAKNGNSLSHGDQSLLPPGVQIILLPTGELALSIQPGINFDGDEIAKLSDILISVQKQITPSAINTSTTGVSEAKEVSIENEVTETTSESFASQNNENVNSQNIVSHDSESNVSNKAGDEYSDEIENVTKDVQGIQSSNDEDSQNTKKSILSDLMEMSGISENDTISESKTINALKKCSPTPMISLPLEIPQTQSVLKTNSPSKAWLNRTVTESLESLKELSMVSSFDELKKCHEKMCQFYKMDIKTGQILPINLKIKKKPLNFNNKYSAKISNSIAGDTRVVIDLTDEVNEDKEPSKSKSVSHAIKPISLIRAIHSTGSTSPRSVVLKPLTQNLTRSQQSTSSLVNILRSKRSLLKQSKITAITNNVFSKPRKFFESNTEDQRGGAISDASDSDSDDEPLAKKALRKRDDATTNSESLEPPKHGTGDPRPLQNEDDEECYTPEFLEPETFDDNDEDGDCILGV